MSIQSRPITSAADQAQWLNQVPAQLPEPAIRPAGSPSIGGWTAINLAVHDPRKIRSVILLDPVFVFGPISTAAIIPVDPGQRRLVTKELAGLTSTAGPPTEHPLRTWLPRR